MTYTPQVGDIVTRCWCGCVVKAPNSAGERWVDLCPLHDRDWRAHD